MIHFDLTNPREGGLLLPASSFFFMELSPLITMNIANAMMTKLMKKMKAKQPAASKKKRKIKMIEVDYSKGLGYGAVANASHQST